MARCKGITNLGHQCLHSVKFGDFCGVHREDKKERTNYCQGITKSGEKCRHLVKRGQFCNLHIIPEQPDHDYSELLLYKPDVNWPSMSFTLRILTKVKCGKELARVFEKYDTIYYPNSLFPMIETSPELIERRDNSRIIFFMQSFFVNYFLDYDTPYWQRIITELVEKTKNIKWLNEYRTLFRKKFDTSFREECQKKYIKKVFECDAGSDVAKKIIGFM